MRKKYGTSQYRLNYATDYAEAINEHMKRIELLWQLGDKGLMSDVDVENAIKGHIASLNDNIEEFKGYYQWREDMEGER